MSSGEGEVDKQERERLQNYESKQESSTSVP